MAPEEIHATAVPQDRRRGGRGKNGSSSFRPAWADGGVCAGVHCASSNISKPYLTYRGGMSVNHPRPKAKLSRALGIPLTPKCVKYFEQRPYPPGDHGRARKSTSDYKVRL